jgi:GABA permease
MANPTARPSAHRILVVANETVAGPELHDAIVACKNDASTLDVLVISPALNSRLRHWLSDDDGARRAAETRLRSCLEQLERVGIAAEGRVGDANPLQAVEDALNGFDADELVIATHPRGRSHWLQRDLIRRARTRFPQPVVHVVVDSEAAALEAAAA